MHIYVFGSICRGEIDRGSDVDMLACTDRMTPQIDPEKFSIYSYTRLKTLWVEGNPFAWHLHLEAKLVYSGDGTDFLKELGPPSAYVAGQEDCKKFRLLFEQSFEELLTSSNSAIFNLSCIFLAVRNYATCHSLSRGEPIFSRNSPLLIKPSLDINPAAYAILARARILSTRGYGERLTSGEVALASEAVTIVPHWMDQIRS